MRLKTIFLIVVTVLLTIVIMQNSGAVFFKVLFFTTRISLLSIMVFTAIVGFVIGYLIGRPNIKKFSNDEEYDSDEPQRENSLTRSRDRQNTLSDEDRDYISED